MLKISIEYMDKISNYKYDVKTEFEIEIKYEDIGHNKYAFILGAIETFEKKYHIGVYNNVENLFNCVCYNISASKFNPNDDNKFYREKIKYSIYKKCLDEYKTIQKMLDNVNFKYEITIEGLDDKNQ